jgi:ABC-2 type transport system ATP-binding protein
VLIRVERLEKTFRVAAHRAGLSGALTSLVVRSYREVRAVRDVSFAIDRGEMVGCLGPNGAGKSTTIKMLTGILVPSGGHVEVLGMVPHRRRKQLAQRIGAVFGQRTQLWWDLPLIDSLELLRYVYRVPAERYARNLARLRDLLDLDGFLRTPVRQLSLGQRMRGDLAAALLHDAARYRLHDLTIEEPDIETIVRRIYEQGLSPLAPTAQNR